MSALRRVWMAWGTIAVLCVSLSAAEVSELVKTIKQVKGEGQGNQAAAQAWSELVQTSPDTIVDVLVALDDAPPLAGNYLRAAFETIAQRAIKMKQPLPAQAIEAFLNERQHDPAGRKLAFDLLVKMNPEAGERLIPAMVDDPSVELRRLAIQRLITQAETLEKAEKKDEAKPIYEQAMASARDEDQVATLVKKLAAYDTKIDLQKHFGFLTSWHVIAPFDNTDKAGFNVVYPPEKQIDLMAELEGKAGKKIKWVPYTTTDPYGKVDLRKALEPFKGAVAYCYTEFESAKELPVEVRLGTKNAWKVWHEDKLLFARDEYHRGQKLDQYKMRTTLKPGKNRFLLKVCQNEQTEDWAQEWEFQIRICDAAGTAIPPARTVATQLKGAN